MATHIYDDALFRAQFPAFEDVLIYPEPLLSGYFTVATCYISPDDSCVLSGDCLQYALNLMTAHLAAINAADPSGASTGGVVSSSTVDKVSVTMQIPSSGSGFTAWLMNTRYGQQLAALLKAKAAGGLYVGGSLEKYAIRKAGGVF